MAYALLALVVVVAAIALLLVYTVKTGISPVPTTPRVAAAIFALIPADTRGVVYELGSGWGNLAFGLARRFPLCSVVGFELSPLPWLVAAVRHRLSPRPNLTLHRADFFATGLGDASVVCCYLYPRAMRRLRPKFERELRADALIVSAVFPVPGWTPATVRTAEDQYATSVYLYRMPPVTEP